MRPSVSRFLGRVVDGVDSDVDDDGAALQPCALDEVGSCARADHYVGLAHLGGDVGSAGVADGVLVEQQQQNRESDDIRSPYHALRFPRYLFIVALEQLYYALRRARDGYIARGILQ